MTNTPTVEPEEQPRKKRPFICPLCGGDQTGMGKDRPGSPIGADAVLPRRGLIWELNYRGELDFLKQAEAQRNERELQLQDGWRYFLHGWTQVIEEVLHIQLSEAQFAGWAQIAAQVR